MPRRLRVMKRIRNAWRRLFKPKVRELEGFDDNNEMSMDDLEDVYMLKEVSYYVEKLRAEHLKNTDMDREEHDSTNDMDSNEDYSEETEVKYIPDINESEGDEMERDEMEGDELQGDEMAGDEFDGDELEGDELEGDTSCTRCEQCGCEVYIQSRPFGQ